ncbi:MAG: heparinase II/III family protein [Kaiparowitsia implicata GSE-PSE-MK54-09C]|jgi:uncharacterized heparinase superfamily protein|nr:heparinase II/III family protein [Kaiparowitsia implicata GSE-PSE-MK54-09C]
MNRLALYWNTVRYLKPSQVLGRIAFRLARPAAEIHPAPPVRPCLRGPVRRAWRNPSLLGSQHLRFLNETHFIAEPGQWVDKARGDLWLYNAHYFDDLTAVDAQDRRDWQSSLINQWIEDNPPATGIGWAPYPTSLRIVNWSFWLLDNQDEQTHARLQSLAVQTRFLNKRIEHHILGNHLLANAKALVFAGLFFAGAEADAWYQKGVDLIERQLKEQILEDGGHFELSPMYHNIILNDVLELLAIHAAFGRQSPQGWQDLVPGMLKWAEAMTHPDGKIGLFNDAAFGIAPTLEQLLTYTRSLGIKCPHGVPHEPLVHLSASGYARMARGKACVITDVAGVGPDYLPAHAHADTLSFELSLGTERVIVNGGTSQYGTGPERLRQRGTANHSTLMLDETNSSEVWSGFRVARRARIISAEVATSGVDVIVRGEHDGYARLQGRPLHARQWTLTDTGLTVADEVRGRGTHRIDVLFHLAPDIIAEREDSGIIALYRHAADAPIARVWSAGELKIVRSSWHPSFGTQVASQCLLLSGTHGLPFVNQTTFRWDPS